MEDAARLRRESAALGVRDDGGPLSQLETGEGQIGKARDGVQAAEREAARGGAAGVVAVAAIAARDRGQDEGPENAQAEETEEEMGRTAAHGFL